MKNDGQCERASTHPLYLLLLLQPLLTLPLLLITRSI